MNDSPLRSGAPKPQPRIASASRRAVRTRALSAALAVLLLSMALAACSTGPVDDMTFTVATVFPTAGADAAAGQAMQRAVALAAADLARAPGGQHGLAAGSAFVVDDGTDSGKAGADAFRQEFAVKHGAISGRATMATVPSDNTQDVVTAIIKATPDVVFFAGGTAAAARLRATITLTGAPQIPVLATGPLADHPAWGAAVGVTAAAAYTFAVLPAPDLSTLPNAKSFVAAYQAAYPGKDFVPQAALAYDAAMDEITAIKALVQAGKPVTRAAVLASVAVAKYAGVTGTLAFDNNGDNLSPPGFAVYSCDIKGAWHYETHLGG